MQLPFVVVFKIKDEYKELVIWADEVEVKPDGLFFIEFLEDRLSIEKAAFRNWEYYYVDEENRTDSITEEEIKAIRDR